MILINILHYFKRIVCIMIMIGLWFLVDEVFQLFSIQSLSIKIGLVIILEIFLLARLVFLEIGFKNTMKGYQ